MGVHGGPAALQVSGHPVHGPDEFGHELRGRVQMEHGWRIDPLDPSAAHEADPIGHGQRLLIVHDGHGSDVQAALQGPDPLAQLHRTLAPGPMVQA